MSGLVENKKKKNQTHNNTRFVSLSLAVSLSVSHTHTHTHARTHTHTHRVSVSLSPLRHTLVLHLRLLATDDDQELHMLMTTPLHGSSEEFLVVHQD